jgi:hypothetical protein
VCAPIARPQSDRACIRAANTTKALACVCGPIGRPATLANPEIPPTCSDGAIGPSVRRRAVSRDRPANVRALDVSAGNGTRALSVPYASTHRAQRARRRGKGTPVRRQFRALRASVRTVYGALWGSIPRASTSPTTNRVTS